MYPKGHYLASRMSRYGKGCGVSGPLLKLRCTVKFHLRRVSIMPSYQARSAAALAYAMSSLEYNRSAVLHASCHEACIYMRDFSLPVALTSFCATLRHLLGIFRIPSDPLRQARFRTSP